MRRVALDVEDFMRTNIVSSKEVYERDSLRASDYITPESAFKPGIEVAYIPYHAKGDINHADVEYGTVTSKKFVGEQEIIFVKFPDSPSCSKGCRPDQLREMPR